MLLISIIEHPKNNYRYLMTITIPYPTKPSETDVLVKLMLELLKLNLDLKTEVKIETKHSFDTVHLRSARFDIVVYEDSIAKIIIEVKRTDNGKATTQKRYYHQLTGLPVIVCGGMIQIQDTVASVTELLKREL